MGRDRSSPLRSLFQRAIEMASKLTDDTIRKVWEMLRKGDHQHDIAARFGLNQGRVSEINTGKRGGHITGLSAS